MIKTKIPLVDGDATNDIEQKGHNLMIRPNIKIGIVYSQNSKKYAIDLKKIIMQRRQEGYCIDVVMVDEEIIDIEREIDARVFKNLDKCSYGIVFLTKDICIKDESYQYVSKPNVLLELGYFKGRINKNNIWCITDFSYKEFKEKYLMPSDIPAEVLEVIDKNNSYNNISKIFDKFIVINRIIKLENYNANDLDSSLLLNPHYKTNYATLFLENQLKTIEKFSEMIYFSLVINSSAIMELIFYKVNVYVFDTDDYSICDELDKYRFSNIDEIEHLLNENSSQEDLFEYTCYTENPKEKYESFFRNIIS